MAKLSKEPEPQPSATEFTPPGGGGRYQLIDGVPEPLPDTEPAVEQPTGE